MKLVNFKKLGEQFKVSQQQLLKTEESNGLLSNTYRVETEKCRDKSELRQELEERYETLSMEIN